MMSSPVSLHGNRNGQFCEGPEHALCTTVGDQDVDDAGVVGDRRNLSAAAAGREMIHRCRWLDG